jgi:aromatic ring-cleaving dioxygenase
MPKTNKNSNRKLEIADFDEMAEAHIYLANIEAEKNNKIKKAISVRFDIETLEKLEKLSNTLHFHNISATIRYCVHKTTNKNFIKSRK